MVMHGKKKLMHGEKRERYVGPRLIDQEMFALCSRMALALFTSLNILQNVTDSPSHRILRHMHEALNIDKKVINYTVCM